MKLSELAAPSLDLMRENGFKALKPHSFGRVRNGVFQFVSFQAQGKDMYIWHNALPTSLPDVWQNAGWKDATGRYPCEALELNSPALELREQLILSTFPRLEQLSSLDELAKAFDARHNIFAEYPKAFCLLQLGLYHEGKATLSRFLVDPIDRLEKRVAHQYLSADADEIQEMLAITSALNIKKYKLRA